MEYRKWKAAKARCYNPKTRQFRDYGGRGIIMSNEWRHDFPAFIAAMGPCPEGYELDRIDNERGYVPGNCRWATPSEQANNKRTTVTVSVDGESMALKAAIERFGSVVPYDTAHHRLTHGWIVLDALRTPPTTHSLGGPRRHLTRS